MNDQIKLQQGLDQVEKLAQGGRWQRFVNHPLRYTKGMWWKEVQYPRLKLVRSKRKYILVRP
ncbi:MAG: hypothetical protein HC892_23620 [Saprospiraceae bacterium]|nr:hypothetical protein [Saprospiraceae bacterium]